MLKNSKILITGGTGSFGRKFTRMTMEKWNPKSIVIYSRDEMKQWDMAKDFSKLGKVKFFIGDVRDRDRLYRACKDVDYIIHTSALKIVPTAEYNPFEYIKTNVHGAMNVIDVAIDRKVKRVVALSTDKASNPVNLYGATKLCSDKLFVAGNSYGGMQDTRFCVVRYGNVMGSRGSVIPYFMSIANKGEMPITNPKMTRFMITLKQAVELVWLALRNCVGGEIYVPKIPVMNIVDIAKTIAPEAKLKNIGVRPGEKLHEQMIGEEDAPNTYEYSAYYKILPVIHSWNMDKTRIARGKRCPDNFCFRSDTCKERMSIQQLKDWIQTEYAEDVSHKHFPKKC